VKGWKRRAACDDGSKMIILLVQPPKNVDDKVVVRDGATEVSPGVVRALHLATVVAHREVALDEVAECGVEVKHVCFIVADELVLDRAADLARNDAMLVGDVLKLAGDRVEDSGEDDGLHAIPGKVVDKRSVREDVVGEFVALQG
jgi:hypothetical protein